MAGREMRDELGRENPKELAVWVFLFFWNQILAYGTALQIKNAKIKMKNYFLPKPLAPTPRLTCLPFFLPHLPKIDNNQCGRIWSILYTSVLPQKVGK